MEATKGHIAVFTLAYEPFEGGAEIAVKEIAARLPSYHFTVFTHRFNSAWEAEHEAGNVRIVRLGRGRLHTEGNYYGGGMRKALYVARAARAAIREHRREPFMAFWGVMAAYGGAAALCAKLRFPRTPFLLTLQEGDAESHILRRLGVGYPLWRFLLRRADQIQAISGYLADFARRHGATCPVVVVPNGVDLSKFSAGGACPSGRRGSSFGGKAASGGRAATRNVTIITTSRLVPKNGVDILIRACALLKTLYPSAKGGSPPKEDGPRAHASGGKPYTLCIVGDGPERKNLERLAQKLGVADRVRFIGAISHDGIPEQLRGADIFVRASRSEGLGNSFLEAMAMGLPVVGTSVGGIPDIVHDGETGLLALPEDADALAAKIHELVAHGPLRRQLGRAGKEFATASYGWDAIAERMGALFGTFSARRVLIATGIFPPEIGGSATWSAFVRDRFRTLGMRTSVVSYGEGKDADGVSFVSRRLPKGFRHFVFFIRLLAALRRHDVMIAADSSFGAATVAAVAARWARAKFLVRVTGDYAWEQGQQRYGVRESVDAFQEKRYGAMIGLLRMFQRYAVRRAHMVIAPSEYLKRMVVGWGVPAERITVIYNAPSGLQAIPMDDARRILKIDGEAHIALTAGRLVPWKGFRALISVAVAIGRRDPQFRLLIAGDGPDRAKLEAQVAAEGAGRCIEFLGSISKGKLAAYGCAADVFVLNTSYEGFSHQIAEMLALGVPVVTTPVGGNPEIIADGKNGLFVPFDDRQGFEEAIGRIVGNREFRKRLSRGAREAAARFSEDDMITSLVKLV